MNKSVVSTEISLLPHRQFEDLISRYYGGEKLDKIYSDFSIKRSKKPFDKLLTPFLALDIECPCCGNSMILLRSARRGVFDSNNLFWRCENCTHINHQICNCKKCSENNEKKLDDLNFDQVIALIALDNCYQQKPGQEVATLNNLNGIFSPNKEYGNHLIDRLCEAEIICNVAKQNNLDKRSSENEERCFAWYMPVEQRKQLINKINEAIESKNWPDSWSTMMSEFSYNLGIEECISYLNTFNDQFDLSCVEVNVLSEKFLNLIEEFSLDQCFIMIYRSMHHIDRFLRANKNASYQIHELIMMSLDYYAELERNECPGISLKESLSIPRSNAVRDALLRFLAKKYGDEDD